MDLTSLNRRGQFVGGIGGIILSPFEGLLLSFRRKKPRILSNLLRGQAVSNLFITIRKCRAGAVEIAAYSQLTKYLP